jgi:hypothetical protein
MGTSQTRAFIAGIRGATTGNADAVAVLIDSAGQLGTISSSIRVKHDVEDMGNASDSLLDLRPVTFIYNGDASETIQYGLIAEEVAKVFPSIVVSDEDGQPETVQYHVLSILLLNELKKQQAMINAQKTVINEQASVVANLIVTVETMNTAISNLQKQLQDFIKCVETI